MDFEVIELAGLTQQQFADLVGVSRVTVNTWARGHYKPGSLTRKRVKTALDLLKDAVEAGRLPVKDNVRDVLLQRQLSRIHGKLAFNR